MKEEITWVLKWYQDEEADQRVFIPFYVKSLHGIRDSKDFLLIWKVDKDTISDWVPVYPSEFKKKFTEVKPTSEEMWDQIKYAFKTKDYFEGVE